MGPEEADLLEALGCFDVLEQLQPGTTLQDLADDRVVVARLIGKEFEADQLLLRIGRIIAGLAARSRLINQILRGVASQIDF